MDVAAPDRPEPPRLLTRALAVRALLRMLLVLGVALLAYASGWYRPDQVMAFALLAPCGAAAATLIQGALVLRSRLRGTAPGGCALSVGLVCVNLHAALIAAGLWWSAPVDLRPEVDSVAVAVQSGVDLVGVYLWAWLLAGLSVGLAAQERDDTFPALAGPGLPWVVAWSVPALIGCVLAATRAGPAHEPTSLFGLFLAALSGPAFGVLLAVDRCTGTVGAVAPDLRRWVLGNALLAAVRALPVVVVGLLFDALLVSLPVAVGLAVSTVLERVLERRSRRSRVPEELHAVEVLMGCAAIHAVSLALSLSMSEGHLFLRWWILSVSWLLALRGAMRLVTNPSCVLMLLFMLLPGWTAVPALADYDKLKLDQVLILGLPLGFGLWWLAMPGVAYFALTERLCEYFVPPAPDEPAEPPAAS